MANFDFLVTKLGHLVHDMQGKVVPLNYTLESKEMGMNPR